MKVLPAAALGLVGSLFLAQPRAFSLGSAASVPQAAVQGRRLFNQSCAGCHDAQGTLKKSGPGLKNFYRHQPRPSDAAVRQIIQQGRGRMPAFGALNRSQVDDLVAYLRTL